MHGTATPSKVTSRNESSDSFLPARQEFEQRLNPSIEGRAIVVSDDGTGVLYVFPVSEGVAEDRVITYDFEVDEFAPVGLEAFNDPEDQGFLRFVWNVGIPRPPGEAL